jgi:hypothetical protein
MSEGLWNDRDVTRKGERNQRTWRGIFLDDTATPTNAIQTGLKLKMGLRGERVATNHSNCDADMMFLMQKMAALWP